MSSTNQVFKLQRPLAGDMTQCLVYNEDRSEEFLIDYDNTLDGLFRTAGNPPRLFVQARLAEDGTFIIDGPASPW